jgi:hypothetical protein
LPLFFIVGVLSRDICVWRWFGWPFVLLWRGVRALFKFFAKSKRTVVKTDHVTDVLMAGMFNQMNWERLDISRESTDEVLAAARKVLARQ